MRNSSKFVSPDQTLVVSMTRERSTTWLLLGSSVTPLVSDTLTEIAI